MFKSHSYDVITVGAGPAGATTAALLAAHGHRVLLLERDPEPRFKIGESLMPQTYWTFQRLGILPELKASAFPRKHSVQFFARGGKPSAPFYFFEESSHESSTTWQVLRSDFDALLFATARRHGAECCRGVNVREVLFDGDVARGVRVEPAPGEKVDLKARVVVDATGQSSLLARRLGLRRVDGARNNASIFTHFKGGLRDAGIDEGATLIFHARRPGTWFWYIPLPGDVVSVGLVGPVEDLVSRRDTPPEETLTEEIRQCPALEKRLQGAVATRPASVLRDFSYRSEKVAGHGWVLVGDAFCFIDPIYSSGVFLALKSGELAADAVAEALATGDPSAERLGSFAPLLVRGGEAIRRLVEAFYAPDFSFARFLKAFPQHRGDVIDILIGNVFDKDFTPLFAAMDKTAKVAERTEPVELTASSGSHETEGPLEGQPLSAVGERG